MREGRRKEKGEGRTGGWWEPVCLKILQNAILLPGEINSEFQFKINLGRKFFHVAVKIVDRSKNPIRGMVAKYGGERGFAVRCLVLYDPVNELKLAAWI